MKRKVFFAAVVMLFAQLTKSQTTIDFEDLTLPADSFWNGADLSGGFETEGVFFVNYYDTSWGAWSGFAYSNMTDTVTAGFTNQYSTAAGEGYDGSSNFALMYVSPYNAGNYLKITGDYENGSVVEGFYVTNNTYAYISMRDGDTYAKKFGGDDGNDPDWFKLTVYGYLNGIFTGEAGFYLADYRFADNDSDYIVTDWKWFDLSGLGTVDSLVFALSSSDTGQYGMNTPAYFCMDNLILEKDYNGNAEFDFNYWNGEDLTAGFYDSTEGDSIFFYNQFTPNSWGGFWTGFAYSQKTDNITSGYTNQYSSITGNGYNASTKYLIGNGNPGMKFNEPQYIKSIKITNTTYAHNSMQDGDMFAKKFGGDDGTDKDWFLLTIKGFKNNNLTNTVNFYLADFRNDDDTKDYIIDSWKNVDLFSLGLIDSIAFSLSSSDNGTYGMNTPAYFALDNISLSKTNVKENISENIRIYPNPASDFVIIQAKNTLEIVISDLSGKTIYQQENCSDSEKININNLHKGVYIVLVKTEQKVYTQKLIKE